MALHFSRPICKIGPKAVVTSHAHTPMASVAHFGPRTKLQALKSSLPTPSSCPPIPRDRSTLGSRTFASSSGSSETAEDKGEEIRPWTTLPWIDSYLPEPLRPYAQLARLDKPIGTWLLLWPFMWSVTLAATPGEIPDIRMLALFGCWSVVQRGAACTINDLFDRNLDSKVERTKMRPLASGALSPFQGIVFFCFQQILATLMLSQLNSYSQILEAVLVVMLCIYPLMKRLTFWPQAFLGVTFNWGAILGWVAIKRSFNPAIVLPLYVSGVCWTLVYDTIYAHQDKEDDVRVGIKSTALKFGSLTKYWLTGFGIACISGLTISGYNAGLAWPYYSFLVAAAGHLGWQILTADLSSPADCTDKFVSNKWFGALIFCGILFGRVRW